MCCNKKSPGDYAGVFAFLLKTSSLFFLPSPFVILIKMLLAGQRIDYRANLHTVLAAIKTYRIHRIDFNHFLITNMAFYMQTLDRAANRRRIGQVAADGADKILRFVRFHNEPVNPERNALFYQFRRTAAATHDNFGMWLLLFYFLQHRNSSCDYHHFHLYYSNRLPHCVCCYMHTNRKEKIRHDKSGN